MVLGLSGLGQAWRLSVTLWGMPSLIGEALLLISVLLWATLLCVYIYQAIWHSETTRQEFLHPVQGSTPALLAVSTLLIVLAVLPYSRTIAWLLTAAGISWHLAFSLWHTGVLWQGGRNNSDTTPALYLPTVAGNFTSAAALGGWVMLIGDGCFWGREFFHGLRLSRTSEGLVMLAPVMLPVAVMSPATVSRDEGDVVPMPT